MNLAAVFRGRPSVPDVPLARRPCVVCAPTPGKAQIILLAPDKTRPDLLVLSPAVAYRNTPSQQLDQRRPCPVCEGRRLFPTAGHPFRAEERDMRDPFDAMRVHDDVLVVLGPPRPQGKTVEERARMEKLAR